MKYKSVVAARLGGPEVLQVVENELRAPGAGEVRIKVLAAQVSRPDVTSRQGKALYSGTPLGAKLPFVPGYSIIGVVDALGPGSHTVSVGDRVAALTVRGGYSEYVYWRSDRLIPVPTTVNPVEAVPLILNYVVAYQTMFRRARAKAGETALILGASGGIGTALLDLGRLVGLKMYAVASRAKHPLVCEYGAFPIDYQTENLAEVILRAEPGGLDVVLDGMTSLDSVRGGLRLLRQGGRLVSFGEPQSRSDLRRILGILASNALRPNGKSFQLYGTSTYSLGHTKPYLEDWAQLFRWLEEGKIHPVIHQCFPLLQAAEANALLESGAVFGNVVLAAAETLTDCKGGG